MSDEVALRPVREDDLAMLEELTQDPEKTGEFEWFGWADLRRWRRDWEENGLISPEGGTLTVTRGDQRLGLVNWHRQPITVRTSYCWEIGIILLPEARGCGYGTQAQRLLARYLFAHTTVHRIWAGTGVDNIAEQSLGEGRVHQGRDHSRYRMARWRLAGRSDLQPASCRSGYVTRSGDNRRERRADLAQPPQLTAATGDDAPGEVLGGQPAPYAWWFGTSRLQLFVRSNEQVTDRMAQRRGGARL